MGENDKEELIERRLSTLEVQVKDIAEIKTKIDGLYNLIMEMKLDYANTKSDFATKAECVTCQKEFENRLDEIEDGRKKLFWASVSTGLVFVFWLIEQLIHVRLTIGG